MIKKHTLLSGLVFGSILIPSLVQADNIGLYAGIGQWNADASGFVSEGNNDPDIVDLQETLAIDDDSGVQAYIAIEHPIPLLPNIRLQHTEIDLNGSNQITENFSFDGQNYDINTQVDSQFDLTHTDATLYWQLWDTVLGVDIGLTARKFSGEIILVAEGDDVSESAQEDIDYTVPLLYTRIGVKFPFTGLTADVRGNFISYDDDSFTDIVARINYEAAFGLGLEAGYRKIELDIEEGNFEADLEISGIYAGISYHF